MADTMVGNVHIAKKKQYTCSIIWTGYDAINFKEENKQGKMLVGGGGEDAINNFK